METALDLLSSVAPPTLESLQNEALQQILSLNQQEESLRNYKTNVTQLIQRYNAQKSYLGYAAHWYGEQTWWFKIIANIVFVGVAIILSIPTIISIILSLVISFLLINHHQVTQVQDQLISQDLEAQNTSVEESVQLLNTTRTELQETLQVLCTLNLEMTQDNMRLRDTLKKAECNLQEYQNNAAILEENIEVLKAKEETLSAQLGVLSEELTTYRARIVDTASSYAKHEHTIGQATASIQLNSVNFSTATSRLEQSVSTCLSKLNAPDSPESLNEEKICLDVPLLEQIQRNKKEAEIALAGYNVAEEQARLNAMKEHMTPPRNNNNTF